MHKSWIFYVPFALILFPAFSYAEPIVLDRLEAAVNKSIILKSDFVRFRRSMKLREQIDPLFQNSPIRSMGKAAADSLILEQLIEDELVLNAFPISDEEVENEINTIQATNRVSREQLKSAVQAQGFLFEDYVGMMRIGASKKNLLQREIKTKISLSAEDIRTYYYAHYSKKHGGSESYKVQMISGTVKDRPKMELALKEAASGSSMETIRGLFPADAFQDLGFLYKKYMNPQMRSAVENLKVGQWSSLQRFDQDHYAILFLSDAKNSDETEIEKVTPEIENILAGGEFQRLIRSWLENERKKNFVHKAGETEKHDTVPSTKS